MIRILLLTTLFFSVGCGGGSPPRAADGETPAPDPAPDVVLLSVSGRNTDFLDPFCPPECNVPYLGEPGGAAEAVITELTGLGLTVEHTAYIASLLSYDDDRFGFLDLLDDLQWIQENWIDGRQDPARIVILAHSHGCVWAHIAASVSPLVDIEVLVSLDGVCFFWPTDHQDSVETYVAANGNPWPYDIGEPCERWAVPGQGELDTSDVVFDNVRFNIEVLSNGTTPFATDERENYRLDGTKTGIESFESTEDNHTDVDEPGTESMLYVLDRLVLALDLP